MSARKIALGFVALAAFVPVFANAASTEKMSLSACAKAFASSIAATTQTAPVYKVAYHNNHFSSVLSDYYPTQYTFELEALNSHGTAVARARCEADTHGVVSALTSIPVASAATTLASR